MSMNVIFVHGWSVTNTNTYGQLPQWLAAQPHDFAVSNIFLGKYISFIDTVRLEDIAHAFNQALHDELGERINKGFACIAHYTGGPLMRLWMKIFYANNWHRCPLHHLIMLAPANHGSALAQLGKGVLGRMQGLFDGVEPGVRILDWLELGSESSWALNTDWLNYNCVNQGIYPFVLTGQSIDRKFYDHLNSYTGEAGSDGVVRVASANMNYSLLRLQQDSSHILKIEQLQRAPHTAFGILPQQAHSGEEMGIIRSVTLDNAHAHPTAQWVLQCLKVKSGDDYQKVSLALEQLTKTTQAHEQVDAQTTWFGVTRKYHISRYTMLIFRFIDNYGELLTDYDLLLTAGPKGNPDDLPQGFFLDRQMNSQNRSKLTYYVDYDILRNGLMNKNMEGQIGFQVNARPSYNANALVYYPFVNFLSAPDTAHKILYPNETLMIEVKLQRLIDARVFRIENTVTNSPINHNPIGKIINS